MFACSDDSHRMNFYEMAQKVDSKESFLRFVQALAEDAEAADAEPERTADGKLNLSPRGWGNGSVSAFLGAMSAWPQVIPESPASRWFRSRLHGVPLRRSCILGISTSEM